MRMAGPIAYVMGPSGAGKDTLLRAARNLLTGEQIGFAHRYITRAFVPGDEEFVPLTAAEFAARRAAGFFAMHWRAHGHDYGIGVEIDAWRHAGWLVVVSGSREHFNAVLANRDDIFPVLITAQPDVLATRLGTRGREDGTAAAARLARQMEVVRSRQPVTVVDNSGAVDESAAALVSCLRVLVKGSAPVA
jgi:ribose 1,5-bisphosphokinase